MCQFHLDYFLWDNFKISLRLSPEFWQQTCKTATNKQTTNKQKTTGVLHPPINLKVRKWRLRGIVWFFPVSQSISSGARLQIQSCQPILFILFSCLFLSFWSTKTLFSWTLINHMFHDTYKDFRRQAIQPGGGVEFQKSEILSQSWKLGQHLFISVFLEPLLFFMSSKSKRLSKSKYKILYEFP